MSVPLRFAVLLYSAALALGMTLAVALTPAETTVLSPQIVSAEESKPPVLYVLRSQSGEICIFQGETLIQRTGVSVSALPKEDREALEIGISATSREALTTLLEDLCS